MCSFVQYNVCGGGTINFISNTLFDRKGSSRLMGFIAFLPVSALESETNNLFFTQHKDMQWADTQNKDMQSAPASELRSTPVSLAAPSFPASPAFLLAQRLPVQILLYQKQTKTIFVIILSSVKLKTL